MRIIEITRDSVSLVDDEDYAHINSFNWALNPQGAGYAVRKGRRGTGEKRTVQMHRQILNAPHGWQIDHINGNSLDNRRSNLRISSVQTNAFNRKKPAVPSTSKYKGVLQRKHKTGWEARVKYSDKAVHLGTFDSERVAAGAYGLNLQAGGSTLIWFGLTWSLELYQQTNARLWRQGQQADTVVIHHIITKGTIDEQVMAALSRKDKTQTALIDAVRATLEVPNE